MITYQLNEKIKILFDGSKPDITDLQIIPVQPDDIELTPIIMSQYCGTIYRADFIPDITGIWLVKIESVLFALNDVQVFEVIT